MWTASVRDNSKDTNILDAVSTTENEMEEDDWSIEMAQVSVMDLTSLCEVNSFPSINQQHMDQSNAFNESDFSDKSASSHRLEFVKVWERIEDDEFSDPADDSFVSNGSTLIGQSPRESLPKICSRNKCVEGTRKSGVLITFSQKKGGSLYKVCDVCRMHSNAKNPKTNAKVS